MSTYNTFENMLSLNQIAAFKELPDRELVARLWNGEEDAWAYIYLNSILPITKKNPFYQIMADRRLSRVDVYGMVFDTLISKRKLELFEFRCPVIYWIRHYTVNEITGFCRKNDIPVSQEAADLLLKDMEAPKDLPKDELVFAQKCFETLWKRNPMRAFIHLLKIKNGLSAKQICRLLNVSSEQNVAKIAERAMKEIREIRDSLNNNQGMVL